MASAPFAKSVGQFAISALAVLCATFVAFEMHFTLAVAAFLYLVIIVLTALGFGFGQATAASFVAVACLDYFFTAPLYSFRVTDPEAWSALAAFEFAGLIVSRLSTQVQRQAQLANEERARAEKLYRLARNILQLNRNEPPGPQLALSIVTSVEVPSVALFDALTAAVHTAGAATAELEQEVRGAWIRDRNEDDPTRHRWSRILRLGGKAIGAITLEAQHLSPLVVDGIASIAAIAFERAHSLEKEALAEAARQSEQLRAAVLDALAHAFKTPLTAIMACSSGLLEAGAVGPEERELIQLIDSEADHLNDLATRLLQTARLDLNAIRVKQQSCTLESLISAVLAPFSGRFEGRTVEVSVVDGDVPVSGDCELIATAISQLVDNAVKYSDPQSRIVLRALAAGKEILVSVHNIGPVIAEEHREHIFERFYRSPGAEQRAAGTGLGLSITRKIAEAHSGRVWVSSSESAGTTFFFAIPLEKGAGT
jgi:two-component system sensor histidine kinase KdpD